MAPPGGKAGGAGGGGPVPEALACVGALSQALQVRGLADLRQAEGQRRHAFAAVGFSFRAPATNRTCKPLAEPPPAPPPKPVTPKNPQGLWKPYVQQLLEAMMLTGLSETLIRSLAAIADALPELLEDIQVGVGVWVGGFSCFGGGWEGAGGAGPGSLMGVACPQAPPRPTCRDELELHAWRGGA
jgi:hypothetical protein